MKPKTILATKVLGISQKEDQEVRAGKGFGG